MGIQTMGESGGRIDNGDDRRDGSPAGGCPEALSVTRGLGPLACLVTIDQVLPEAGRRLSGGVGIAHQYWRNQQQEYVGRAGISGGTGNFVADTQTSQ